MFKKLLASIEAELNKVVEQQQASPRDINIATKKLQLMRLADEYLKLEGRFKEIAGLNIVY